MIALNTVLDIKILSQTHYKFMLNIFSIGVGVVLKDQICHLLEEKKEDNPPSLELEFLNVWCFKLSLN